MPRVPQPRKPNVLRLKDDLGRKWMTVRVSSVMYPGGGTVELSLKPAGGTPTVVTLTPAEAIELADMLTWTAGWAHIGVKP